MTTDLTRILTGVFQENQQRPLFVGLDDRIFSYRSFWLNAQSLAARWHQRGLKPGAVIAFVLPNNVALPCCYLACAIGGYVACPIIASFHPDMIETLLELVDADLVVTELPEMSGHTDESLETNYQLAMDQHQPFLILFTSGSTGTPKAMVHSLHNIIGSARSFVRLSGMSTQTRLYHVLPMAYMAGILNAFFAPMLAEACIVEGPSFSPATAIDFWQRPLHHQVNTLSLTPTIANALLRFTRNPQTLARIEATVSQIQCTSAPIRQELAQAFYERFHLPLQNCYGMTEIGGPLTFQSHADAIQYRDWSELLDEIGVQIRGAELQSPGELWLKSPFLMLGYLEQGNLSRPFDAQGYMNTGDLAFLADRKIRIAGRKKDIIIRGGINVSPMRIESVFSGFAKIRDCAVVGLPHDFWGEEIVACVVVESGKGLEQDQLNIYLRQQLDEHERPDRVIVVERIPRTPIGKLQKAELLSQLERILTETK